MSALEHRELPAPPSCPDETVEFPLPPSPLEEREELIREDREYTCPPCWERRE